MYLSLVLAVLGDDGGAEASAFFVAKTWLMGLTLVVGCEVRSRKTTLRLWLLSSRLGREGWRGHKSFMNRYGETWLL